MLPENEWLRALQLVRYTPVQSDKSARPHTLEFHTTGTQVFAICQKAHEPEETRMSYESRKASPRRSGSIWFFSNPNLF